MAINIITVLRLKIENVVVLACMSIPFKKLSDLEFKKSIFESSVIEIDKHVLHSRHNIIIGIFYRSPNSALIKYL